MKQRAGEQGGHAPFLRPSTLLAYLRGDWATLQPIRTLLVSVSAAATNLLRAVLRHRSVDVVVVGSPHVT